MKRFWWGLLLSLSMSQPCWAGASLDFNGTSDRVDLANVTPLVPSFPWTVACIASTDQTDATYRICANNGKGGDSGWVFGKNNSGGTLIFCKYQVACFTGTSTTEMSTSTWYTIAAVVTSSAITFYRITLSSGAVASESTADSQAWDNSPTPANGSLGCSFDNGGTRQQFWDGQIAAVMVWNQAVSQVDLLQASTLLGTVPTSEVGFWFLTGGSSNEPDLSGNGVTGTTTGATASANGPPVMLTTPLAWWQRLQRFWSDLFLPSAWADDIILCNPTDPIVPGHVSSYQRSADPFKSGATTNPNSLIFSLPASPVNPWNGIVPPASQSYWKCSGSTVVEMSQAEKDAVDAPGLAEASRQAAFVNEITTNNVCTAELSEIDTRIDALIDPVANLSDAKVAMKIALKKVARCLRARSR